MLSTENCNNDSRHQIAATTAVILIDFQNDIVKPDSKLHADVSAITVLPPKKGTKKGTKFGFYCNDLDGNASPQHT